MSFCDDCEPCSVSKLLLDKCELTMEHKIDELFIVCKQISYLTMFSYSFPLTCTGLAQGMEGADSRAL